MIKTIIVICVNKTNIVNIREKNNNDELLKFLSPSIDNKY